MVEVFGFLTCVVGVYILGHENSVVTMILHTLAMIIYTIILPCSILINSPEVKEHISESSWYANFISILGWKSKPEVEVNRKEEQITKERSNKGVLPNRNPLDNERNGIENEEVAEKNTGQDSHDDDSYSNGKQKRTNKLHDVEVIDLEFFDTKYSN